MYVHQLPPRNVNIVYYRHILKNIFSCRASVMSHLVYLQFSHGKGSEHLRVSESRSRGQALPRGGVWEQELSPSPSCRAHAAQQAALVVSWALPWVHFGSTDPQGW